MPTRALVATYSFNSNSDSRSVTIPTGCEVLEIAICTIDTGVDQTSVTCGGQALTKIGPSILHSGGARRMNVWRLISPPTGAQTVVVTNGGMDVTGVAVNSWTVINTTTPFDGWATAQGSSVAPSVAVTSASGDTVADAVASHSTSALTPGGAQTELWDFTPIEGRFGGSHEAGGASVTMSWTSGDEQWVIAAFNAKKPGVDTGFLIAGSGANVDKSSGVPWTNPTNIVSDNASGAQLTLDSSQHSDYLMSGSHEVALPAGAIVAGFEIRLDLLDSLVTGEPVFSIALTKNGTVHIGTPGIGAFDVGLSTYGGPTDLFGATWTKAEVEASTFGVALFVAADSFEDVNLVVDAVWIVVHYTEGGGPVEHTDAATVNLIMTASGVDEYFGEPPPERQGYYTSRRRM